MAKSGSERVLNKLKISIEQGNYYEAHQMYRTLNFRYLAQQRYVELVDLLYEGAVLFMTHGQHNSGSDLAVLFVEALNKSKFKVTDVFIDKLGYLHTLMKVDSPERINFLTSALQWSSNSEEEHYPRGHPRLHQLVAVTLWKEKNYAQSKYHFIHSTDGDGCATMLVEYHCTKGYPNEVDLFIAQAVFQYLCLKNKATATIAFHAYAQKHPKVNPGPPFLLPLLNFLWFLLPAIDNGKLPVFTVLCEQYRIALNRDPSYLKYLDKIGQLFFGMPPPPPKQQGLFGNILQSLFGGLEDDDMSSEENVALPGPSKVTSKTIQYEELD